MIQGRSSVSQPYINFSVLVCFGQNQLKTPYREIVHNKSLLLIRKNMTKIGRGLITPGGIFPPDSERSGLSCKWLSGNGCNDHSTTALSSLSPMLLLLQKFQNFHDWKGCPERAATSFYKLPTECNSIKAIPIKHDLGLAEMFPIVIPPSAKFKWSSISFFERLAARARLS